MRTVVLRQILLVSACVAVGLAALISAGSDVMAQSLFETLFGLGESRPLPATPSAAVRATSWPTVARERRAREPRSLGVVSAESGSVVQTMCVRSCDGYYWPVRYPAKRDDLSGDAKVCASTCGAEAKLYYRAGPGTEPEEMKDADGNSYGGTKTAFAYRKGLTKGCSCRSMPWSEAERARHEGYALAEAEKAIRIAQVEDERVAAVQAAVEKAESDKRHGQLVVAISQAEATRDFHDYAPGPAEAAAIAGFSTIRGDAGGLTEPLPRTTRTSSMDRRRNAYANVGLAPVRRTRLPRGYANSGVRPVAPKYAATGSYKLWWLQ